MTIIGHSEKQGANTVQVTLEGREYTSELFVDSNDPEDTGHAVVQYLIAQGYRYGKPYDVGNDDLSSRTPINTYLYQIDPPALAPGSSTKWIVTLRYRQVTPDLNVVGGGGLAQTPFERRPAISTSTVTRSEPLEEAIYRGGLLRDDWELNELRAITNSADDPFIPPYEIEYQNRVVRVVRNFPAVNINNITMPLKWINSVAFTLSDRQATISIAAFTLKLLNWATEPVFEDGYDFVRITFEGEIEEDGWRLRILDKGFNEVEPERYNGQGGYSRKKKPIREEGQGRSAVEALLDGAGGRLIKKDDNPPKTGADAKYGIWSGFREIDPRSLGFFYGIAS
jgi:hypothetical protein